MLERSLAICFIFKNEIFIFSFIYQYLESIKVVIYRFTPVWVEGIYLSFNSIDDDDDEYPPELEYNHNFIDERQIIYKINHSNNCTNTTTNSFIESYVFDSIYGVIPSELQDEWNLQEIKSLMKRDEFIKNKIFKRIPPVRFSSKKLVNSN
jgi:hypothetical protein